MSKFLTVFAALILIMMLMFLGAVQFVGYAQYNTSEAD